jgi:hypothetical protein
LKKVLNSSCNFADPIPPNPFREIINESSILCQNVRRRLYRAVYEKTVIRTIGI